MIDSLRKLRAEPSDEGALSGAELGLRHIQTRPCDAVDLRERRRASRARRPLHLEQSRFEGRRVDVGLDGEQMNDLRRAGDHPKIDRGGERGSSGNTKAEFFAELADGTVEGFFRRVEHTFRKGPRSFVLLRPERSTQMAEEHLDE